MLYVDRSCMMHVVLSYAHDPIMHIIYNSCGARWRDQPWWSSHLLLCLFDNFSRKWFYFRSDANSPPKLFAIEKKFLQDTFMQWNWNCTDNSCSWKAIMILLIINNTVNTAWKVCNNIIFRSILIINSNKQSIDMNEWIAAPRYLAPTDESSAAFWWNFEKKETYNNLLLHF